MTLDRHSVFAVACAACVFAAGSACGSDDDATGPDAAFAKPAPPPACEIGAPPGNFVYPAGPYGQEVGETFEDITLNGCDGEPVRFGDILAQSDHVLFNIGAGWCDPCIEETATLEAQIYREFCPRGLQVVQVLFQDDQSRPATSLFCNQWESERFSLSFPVLIDPLFETMKFFESVQAQTPINFVIDSNGVIVFKETGTPAADLPSRLDGLLPTP